MNCDRETLKHFVLNNSLNRMNDLSRAGIIGLDFHSMAVCIWHGSRMEWDKAKAYVDNQISLGFTFPKEREVILSVLAEICPSVND